VLTVSWELALRADGYADNTVAGLAGRGPEDAVQQHRPGMVYGGAALLPLAPERG